MEGEVKSKTYRGEKIILFSKYIDIRRYGLQAYKLLTHGCGKNKHMLQSIAINPYIYMYLYDL